MLMVAPIELWPTVAGLAVLAIGIVLARKDVATASDLEKLIVLGPVFYAAPLATFGAEHLTAARGMSQMVPVWIPWHLFWAYFVGCSLIAAALSLIFKKCVRWTAPLLTLLFFLFVCTIHLPNTIHAPHDRIIWAVLTRDSCFCAGALALTATTLRDHRALLSKIFIVIARIVFGVTLLYYGVVQILYPTFAPGVPLEKLTPAWVLAPHFWAALVGGILLIAGVAILINKRARFAAALVGLVMVALTVFLYTPIWLMDRGTAQVVEGINYVFDTLLYGGTILLLAAALPDRNALTNSTKPGAPHLEEM
jgi:uncharacterized membrane protein YphA (DoxX/SURF4 family)